jgi:hypothetical protein
MDLFDELATELAIDPDRLYDLRKRYGGQDYYIKSARSETQRRIRQERAPLTLIARKYQVCRRSVQRICARND